MIGISGILTFGGLAWQTWPGDASDIGVRLSFVFLGSSKIQKREAVKAVQRRVEEQSLSWLAPDRKEWTVDCEQFKDFFECLKDCDWLKGNVQIEPEWEEDQEEVFGKTQYTGCLVFELTPQVVEEAWIMAKAKSAPPEIADSLKRFIQDHPDQDKSSFIMMQFGTTRLHNEIVDGIRAVLGLYGITALRADDKQYHDDLFPNVLTYMHGCGFGIAVFERLETNDFNPNVSLELRYMLAFGKPVCLLKDRTLQTLNTDLVGKLYKSFDPQDPAKTMSSELEQWLKDKGLV